jgi:hypothetical protein
MTRLALLLATFFGLIVWVIIAGNFIAVALLADQIIRIEWQWPGFYSGWVLWTAETSPLGVFIGVGMSVIALLGFMKWYEYLR